MALTNYTDLKAAVASYLHRTDLTSQIVDFIRIAEADFDRTLRLNAQLTNAALSCSAVATALPTDWLQTKQATVAVGGLNQVLLPSDEEQVRQYTTAGTPKYYAISGGYFLIGPPPSTTYTVSHTYYAAIPALATNSTNWLLTAYPDMYLWRTILEGAKYTRDQDLVLMAGTEYQRILADAITRDQNKATGVAPTIRLG